MADIIVYGGGFQAVAAAANNALRKSGLVIVPYPVSKLGGIATVGGQIMRIYVDGITLQADHFQLCC